MEVKAKKYYFTDKDFEAVGGDEESRFKVGDLKEIKVEKLDLCCDEIDDAIEGGAIGFGDRKKEGNQNVNVNAYGATVVPEGVRFDSFKINSCPFCGKEIKVEIEE